MMGILDKIGRKSDAVDIEEFLNNLDVEEESMYEDADAYVKPYSLQRDTDAQAVIEEVKKGNIVLLNIADLSKRNAMKLRELISTIRNEVQGIDGDMARVSSDRVLVTPSRVKIVKRKEA